MIKLRDYQQRAIDQLYSWFQDNDNGHPCIEMPTGSGKSFIIAALCKDALQSWPETRILMLTHVRELIEQNADKMRLLWPNAPLGIYSAGIGKRDLGEPITFAGIQSVRKKAKDIGFVDLIIVDESHLIGHRAEGGYRTLIKELKQHNPGLRVIGLTATPYRLGHGLITDDPAIFKEILKPTSIEELVFKGHLAPLRSKVTSAALDVSRVRKRGGEFVEKDLQEAVNVFETNAQIASEIVSRAEGRKSWIVFCAGVAHAEDMASALAGLGVKVECVTGTTTKKERDRILAAFKAGELTAITNANVLTTGFDAPNTDLIALVRPTMSPSLYVQMAGRGMRTKDHIDHCLVLDFAGCVATHGPITAIVPPTRKGDGAGDAPVKACPECGELIHASIMHCPACGHVFERLPQATKLHNDDIMGFDATEMAVGSWSWQTHISRASGRELLKVTYYEKNLFGAPVTEYFCVGYDGYAGAKARQSLAAIANMSGSKDATTEASLARIADAMNEGCPPKIVEYKKDGKFYRVLDRRWADVEAREAYHLERAGEKSPSPNKNLLDLQLSLS